jgi:prevent-host-death family protein
MNNIWQLQEAKSRFSELVEKALAQGVQIVTRRGRKTVVILPYDEYQRMIKPEDSLVQFLLDSPLRGSSLEIERDQSLPRDLEIEA